MFRQIEGNLTSKRTKYRKSSKSSDSDDDLIKEIENPSQELLSEHLMMRRLSEIIGIDVETNSTNQNPSQEAFAEQLGSVKKRIRRRKSSETSDSIKDNMNPLQELLTGPLMMKKSSEITESDADAISTSQNPSQVAFSEELRADRSVKRRIRRRKSSEISDSIKKNENSSQEFLSEHLKKKLSELFGSAADTISTSQNLSQEAFSEELDSERSVKRRVRRRKSSERIKKDKNPSKELLSEHSMKKKSSEIIESDADTISTSQNATQKALSEELGSKSERRVKKRIRKKSSEISEKNENPSQELLSKHSMKKKTSDLIDSDAKTNSANPNPTQEAFSEKLRSERSMRRRIRRRRSSETSDSIKKNKNPSQESCPGELKSERSVKRRNRRRKSSESSDSIKKNSNPSQELLSEHSMKKKSSDADMISSSQNSTQEAFSEELVSDRSALVPSSSSPIVSEISVDSIGVKPKKRSHEKEERDKKQSKKPRHTRKRKEISSDRDTRIKKASQEVMAKWLSSPSKSMANTSNSTSLKQDLENKSSQDDTPSIIPKKDVLALKHKRKKRRKSQTKNICQDIVSSQTPTTGIEEDNSLKTSQNIMTKWLSPSASPKIVLKSAEIVDLLTPIKSEERNKKTQRKSKKIPEKTASKENLSSQNCLSTWLSPSKTMPGTSGNASPKTVLNDKPSESIDDVKATTKCKVKRKPATKLKSSQDALRNITEQEISATSQPIATERWLSKNAAKENIAKPKKRSNKMSPLDISTKRVDNVSKNATKTKKRSKKIQKPKPPEDDDLPSFISNLPEQNESVKRYVMPTVKEILAERKQFLVYKALVDKAEIIPLAPNPFIDRLKEPAVKPPMKLLDCEHLTLEDIKKQFIKNKSILENIKSGYEFSDRHKKFHNGNKGLAYSDTNLVFTYDQINCMANLIREELDPQEKHLRYTFTVLIPELCLLIFMDTHNMTKEESVKYLDERPLN